MKRIIDGVTYNTDTSAKLASSEWETDEGNKVNGVLYQTRGGAFFVHCEVSRQVWNESEQRKELKVTHEFEPLSSEDALKWLTTGEVEIFHNPFGDPPEASAEPSSALYIRVPTSLKRRVDEAAAEAKLSGNVWATRCVERCLRNFRDYRELAYMWEIISNVAVHPDGEWPKRRLINAMKKLEQFVEEHAIKLGLSTEDIYDAFQGDIEFEDLKREFQPYS